MSWERAEQIRKETMSATQAKAAPKQKAIAAISKRYEDENAYKWDSMVSDLYDAGQKDANGKLLKALKAAQLELLQTKPSEYSHDVLNLIEAAIQSGEEPASTSALSAVRARWERLGLDPSTAPTVFASDVENMVEEELRRLRDGAGRAVVQYDDPAS